MQLSTRIMHEALEVKIVEIHWRPSKRKIGIFFVSICKNFENWKSAEKNLIWSGLKIFS